jgi:hypothetical protein
MLVYYVTYDLSAVKIVLLTHRVPRTIIDRWSVVDRFIDMLLQYLMIIYTVTRDEDGFYH